MIREYPKVRPRSRFLSLSSTMKLIGVLVVIFGLVWLWLLFCQQNRDIKDIQATVQKLTTTQPAITAPDQTLDIVAKVEAFYSHILMFLFPVVALVGIFATIVVPIVVHHLQRETFGKEIGHLEKSMEQLKEFISQKEKTSFERLNHYAAFLWIEMAESFFQTKGKAWQRSFKYYCYAIDGGLEAHWKPDYHGWQRIIDALGDFKKAETQKGIAKDDPHTQLAIRNTLKKLEPYGDDEPYLTLRDTLEWWISTA